MTDAGWHFSYLMDLARIHRKIAAFSHQEFNNDVFLRGIDIAGLVRTGGDLFQRSGFTWSITSSADLPEWVQSNRRALQHLFAPSNWLDRLRRRVQRTRPRPLGPAASPPVVICPYLFDAEPDEIRDKFGLNQPKNARIPFFLWQDRERMGPERAFEVCWDRFPDRDIIIVHSDMSPFPGEAAAEWYEQLCEFRTQQVAAGMIAANLFYPRTSSDQTLRVQCAGGTFINGTIGHIHGDIASENLPDGIPEQVLRVVRPVSWVTFGGVLIRRELIRACGAFDRRYQWAYVMDVDYSFEARFRGFRLLQVPVRLQHEESRSTRKMWAENPALCQHIATNLGLFYEKWRPFASALPDPANTVPSGEVDTNSPLG